MSHDGVNRDDDSHLPTLNSITVGTAPITYWLVVSVACRECATQPATRAASITYGKNVQRLVNDIIITVQK